MKRLQVTRRTATQGRRCVDRPGACDVGGCRDRPKITDDTLAPKGEHKVHKRMCNRRYYESFGVEEQIDGCHEIKSRAVAPYRFRPEDIPDTVDFFMNYHQHCGESRWVAEASVSRPGDHVELDAEIDGLVALSNCPDGLVSPIDGHRCTSERIEVLA